MNSDIEIRFGEAIKHWRTRQRVSQEELGKRSHLHRSYISDIERGARNVSLKTVERIANALNVPVSVLFSTEQPSVKPLTADQMVDILLVEDSDRDIELTMEALKAGRITNRIYVVRDGVAALDFLFCTGSFAYRRPDDHPQIVLLDLNLPKIDGIEVLRRIKADPRTRSIPVVVLTNSKDDRNIVATKKLGAETYIVKPVDLQNFSSVTLQFSLQWALLKPTDLPISSTARSLA